MENQGLGSWIHRRRRKSAGRTALVFQGRSISYSELDERINRLAQALRASGVDRGTRVAFLGDNHPAFLETFFAAGTLGAVFVPLNTRLAPPEIRFALQDSGSLVLVHTGALAGLAQLGSADTSVTVRLEVADGAASAGRPAAGGAAGGVPGADAAVPDFDAVIAGASPDRLDLPVGLDDAAMILYTSGTTGQPKGALLSHANLAWNCYNVLVDYDVSGTEVALMISPMFHVASLDMGVLPVLLKGGTVVLETRFEPGRTLAAIEQYAATYISGVPTTFQMLCEHPDWDKRDISSLTTITCGGSAVPLRVLEAYEARGLSFSNGYGMTETAPGATALPAARSREKAGSAGLPHFFTDVRVAGPDGAVLPAGEVGEIQISGPNVIRSYWNRPAATTDAYAEGAWFRSGDMGYFDDDGYLFISDRLKDMIISGGENIYPAEVEQAVAELEAVAAVAVIGVPDSKWGEVPHALISLREGYALTSEEVQEHLFGRLARYKVPRTVTMVEDFPRTASGKIRKAELRRQYPG
ncbi:long-chain-fatty-acid--CoA ligase [Arthrobacter yangruifuii]|uniref:Long-chain-fatty-acid--CoA ligase n=1 Tax=Arthrobacter yangruifuii TaxID=2606616 RepID=A0A5N6MS56_9MICC|nr:long-chain fatty acid--CoA ligase [Arthrobacter yangruifuii]KAD4060019.1 long-chain-fatty-acid--CoA ligase [Arthrobacter yangruifuii]